MNFNIKESNKTKEKRQKDMKERKTEERFPNPDEDKDDLIHLDTNINSK
jgi:hypothetical protein